MYHVCMLQSSVLRHLCMVIELQLVLVEVLLIEKDINIVLSSFNVRFLLHRHL